MNDLIKNKSPDKIYNCDETALFWKLLPSKTFAFTSESRFGTRKCKERITLLLISNADGTNRQAIVIGKSKTPRCFRSQNHLPLQYYQQKNAWMDSFIFEKIFKKLNNRIKKENKHILLFMDNCSVHFINLKLSNIQIIYFPSNTTSVLQPLDCGIIKSFKTNYRNDLVSHLISEFESGNHQNFKQNFTLVTAITFIDASLKKIKQETIKNCFKKAGFVFQSPKTRIEIEEEDDDDSNIWTKLNEFADLNYESFECYFDVDIDLQCHHSLTDQQIVNEVLDKSDSETELEDDEDENEVDNYDKDITSSKAFKYIKQLQIYFLNRNNSLGYDYLLNAQNQLTKIQFSSLKQSKITDFFE